MSQNLSGRHKKWMQLIDNLKGEKILDIGCSYGWFENFAIKSGCQKIIGLEPKEKDFIKAKQEVPQAKFHKGSALNIPFPDKYFDLVTLFDVIEHLPRKSETKALKEIKRVLKTDGILFISTPHKTILSNILDPAWYLGHRHYSKKRINNLLSQTGFNLDWLELGGGVYSQLYMILFYIYKFIFHQEMDLFKDWFAKKREAEYLNKKGFTTLFIKASLNKNL